MILYWQIMNFNAFYIFLLVSFLVVTSDHYRVNITLNQRFRQVVRTYRATFLRNIKMLMEDQNFHATKKRIDVFYWKLKDNSCLCLILISIILEIKN